MFMKLFLNRTENKQFNQLHVWHIRTGKQEVVIFSSLFSLHYAPMSTFTVFHNFLRNDCCVTAKIVVNLYFIMFSFFSKHFSILK